MRRVIRKMAYCRAAAVVYRCQFATRGIVVSRQRRGGQSVRVFRVVGQPYFCQTKAVVRVVRGGGQSIREGKGFCATGGYLLPVLCCPLRLRGQHQPEAAACTVRHGADFPGCITGSGTMEDHSPP